MPYIQAAGENGTVSVNGIKGLLSLECSEMSRQLLVFNCEQIKIYCFALLSVEMKRLYTGLGGLWVK